jgi:hypothetical protein
MPTNRSSASARPSTCTTCPERVSAPCPGPAAMGRRQIRRPPRRLARNCCDRGARIPRPLAICDISSRERRCVRIRRGTQTPCDAFRVAMTSQRHQHHQGDSAMAQGVRGYTREKVLLSGCTFLLIRSCALQAHPPFARRLSPQTRDPRR